MTMTLRHHALGLALCAGLSLAACDAPDSEDASARDETAAVSVVPEAGDVSPVASPGPEAPQTVAAGSTDPQSPGGSAVTENELPPSSDVPPAPPRAVFSMDGTAAEPAPVCDFESWVGKPVDEATIKASGRIYRILKPDSMMTMDHNPDRINVIHDDKNIVTKVWCG